VDGQSEIQIGKIAHGPSKGIWKGDEDEGSSPHGRLTGDYQVGDLQPGKSNDQRKPSGCATTRLLSFETLSRTAISTLRQGRMGNQADNNAESGPR
jgi:hypothetical protein